MATALMAAKEGNYRVASFESHGSVTLVSEVYTD
jgi:hypothetical protein